LDVPDQNLQLDFCLAVLEGPCGPFTVAGGEVAEEVAGHPLKIERHRRLGWCME